MKYKVQWIEQKTGKSGKNYWIMSLLDEQNTTHNNVSTFEATYQAGMEIEGEIVQNGNYLNWKPKLEAPKDPIFKRKSVDIEKAQERKATSIAEAQDRSAWMWSKNNASLLIANNEKYKNLSAMDQFAIIEELATKIYNSEPLAPFN